MSDKKLSHVDLDGRPRMVNVSDKAITQRNAVAEAVVRFPLEVAKQLREQNLRAAKGSIIDTAIIAGTMAAKKTADLIPFCHPLPIEHCHLSIEWQDDGALRIRSQLSCSAKTGVEMEALTACSIAALTVYDMCKALSHEIVIEQIRLVEKRGGKSDVG